MPLARRKSQVPAVPTECPLVECMKLLGGLWTPNLVWHLSAGPRRFSELRADVVGISAKVLSARLRALELRGVVSRQVVPSKPPSVEYALTELGLELMPVIRAIVRVGAKLKEHHPPPRSTRARA